MQWNLRYQQSTSEVHESEVHLLSHVFWWGMVIEVTTYKRICEVTTYKRICEVMTYKCICEVMTYKCICEVMTYKCICEVMTYKRICEVTHLPSVLRPGLEVNLATSTIFTANCCLVSLWIHRLTTLNGPLQQNHIRHYYIANK